MKNRIVRFGRMARFFSGLPTGAWRLARCARGDVLMEYVIVTVFIVLPLIGAATSLFNPSGQTFNVAGTVAGDNFGVIGDAFVEVFRRIMCGIGLPIP